MPPVLALDLRGGANVSGSKGAGGTGEEEDDDQAGQEPGRGGGGDSRVDGPRSFWGGDPCVNGWEGGGRGEVSCCYLTLC